MKILFLGASSFTGYHFVKQISKNKTVKIFCTLTQHIHNYKYIRKERINLLKKIRNVKILSNITFGSRLFIELIKKEKFDILCFHYSHTKNYNDDKKFNLKKAKKKNLKNIKLVFNNINNNQKIIISNTIFQQINKKKYAPVNKYGISKTYNYEIFKKFCLLKKIKYKSIFIPNPWGILEERKLNYHLIKKWFNNEVPVINYPKYIRDNIFITKLSYEYYKIIFSKSKKRDYFPSGYCSTNKVFIEALKNEFIKKFRINAKVKYIYNQIHAQPIKRINGSKILKKIRFKEDLKSYFRYYKNLFN